MESAQATYPDLVGVKKHRCGSPDGSNIVIRIQGDLQKIIEASDLNDRTYGAAAARGQRIENEAMHHRRYIRSLFKHLAHAVEEDPSSPVHLDVFVDSVGSGHHRKMGSPSLDRIETENHEPASDTSHGPAGAIFYLLNQIELSTSVSDTAREKKKLPSIIRYLVTCGVDARALTHYVSMINDAILKKAIGFTTDAIGAPPTSFVFMALGSEGRKEQTLSTDQDNAIIYADMPSGKKRAKSYFDAFGNRVCTLLHELGYDYCTGEVMAKNPKWCQPLSVWKKYFSRWIHTADPQSLLQSSIFFDFRGVYGDLEMSKALRTHLFDELTRWPGFFKHLVENALYFRPPSGSFSNFVLMLKGRKRHAIDTKSALLPIVDLVRIYALKHGVKATNTWERIAQLRAEAVFTHRDTEEIIKAFNTLMEMRLRRQLDSILDSKSKPDNHIKLKNVTKIERAMIKEIFRQERNYQSKMRFTFVGAC